MAEAAAVFMWPENPIGKLWFRSWNGRESASFQYDPSWIDSPGNFALEPALIDTVSREASLETALSVIGEFRLKKEKALVILGEVRRAVGGWRNAALSLGISRRETDRMASAFEGVN